MSLACTLVSALEVCVPFPSFLQGVGTRAQGSAEDAAGVQLAQHCRGGGSLPPTPLIVYTVPHTAARSAVGMSP